MDFERWNPKADRFGLFSWQGGLYLIPLHPIANRCDSERACRIIWRPDAKGVPDFLRRDEILAPIAGPFRTREAALERANHPELRHRYRGAGEEEPA